MKIEEIKSNITSETLHYVIRYSPERQKQDRKDIIDPDNYLQLSLLNYDKGKTFIPHKHLNKKVSGTTIAQESWLVLRGTVRAIFYDIDDSVITEKILNTLDASITLKGGHNYEILDDNTLVYEFKTGPYKGQKLDKVSI
tara:strand:- start:305 stop:724 length:420 start_codon:yes stop_codon:yes gene_type:complete